MCDDDVIDLTDDRAIDAIVTPPARDARGTGPEASNREVVKAEAEADDDDDEADEDDDDDDDDDDDGGDDEDDYENETDASESEIDVDEDATADSNAGGDADGGGDVLDLDARVRPRTERRGKYGYFFLKSDWGGTEPFTDCDNNGYPAEGESQPHLRS